MVWRIYLGREHGDFQTPPKLVASILRALRRDTKNVWSRVLEPTCGRGNFIVGLHSNGSIPKQVIGIEIQKHYAAEAKKNSKKSLNGNLQILNDSIFNVDLSKLKWKANGHLLVVGNLPWVTNSELGKLKSSNLPSKQNIKGLSGFDAMTGASNFDIAEAIWIKLLRELPKKPTTVALLCKTIVARNILKYVHDNQIPIREGRLWHINSAHWFDAAVDACLFQLDLYQGEAEYQVDVYPDLDEQQSSSRFGVVDGLLVSNVTKFKELAFLSGKSKLQWRQGIKHDAAPVMELKNQNGRLVSKEGISIDVEKKYVFPLLKSSDLFQGECKNPRYSVLITQTRLNENTQELMKSAPKLWEYLNSNKEIFSKRKSSIYRGKPMFSIFGVGEYSFAPFKVAISGLYKEPKFRLVGSNAEGKPTMLDDTCYFLPCDSVQQAAILTALLNSKPCLEFLNTMVFWDSKRPVTKALLQRFDLSRLLSLFGREKIIRMANAEAAQWSDYTLSDEWPADLGVFLGEIPIHAIQPELVFAI